MQVGGEEGRLVAAGARADLDDRGAVVERVGGDEQRLQLPLELGDAGLEPELLGACFLGHLRVVNGNELAHLRELVLVLPELAGLFDDGAQALVLATEAREELRVTERSRVEQLVLELLRPPQRLVEAVAEAQAVASGFAYFWRKRSTRPAVSISFCLPVKNGWQLLQMSVLSVGSVERVWKTLPQAHFTVAVWYSGWISVFTEASQV
jgi:hypothetical protein